MNNKECQSCPHTDKCREVWSEENRGPLSPKGLVICSISAFLLPLVLAIIFGTASRAYGFTETIQIFSALLGFVIGVAVAIVIVYYAKDRFKRDIPHKDCINANEELV